MSDEEKLLREAFDVLRDLKKQDDTLCRGDVLDIGAAWRLLQKLEKYYE
jgi:hypothetical protein